MLVFAACSSTAFFTGGLDRNLSSEISISTADVVSPPGETASISIPLAHQHEISQGIDSLVTAYEATRFDIMQISAQPFSIETASITNFMGIDSMQVWLKSDQLASPLLLGKQAKTLELAAFDSHIIQMPWQTDMAPHLNPDYSYGLMLIVFPNEQFEELGFEVNWGWNISYDGAKE
jgi:uncharacterized protein with NAD-binding domain and iron-sulfur cluster